MILFNKAKRSLCLLICSKEIFRKNWWMLWTLLVFCVCYLSSSFPFVFLFFNRKLVSENFSVTFYVTSRSFSYLVNESLTLPQNHSINDGDLSQKVTQRKWHLSPLSVAWRRGDHYGSSVQQCAGRECCGGGKGSRAECWAGPPVAGSMEDPNCKLCGSRGLVSASLCSWSFVWHVTGS